MIFSFKKKQHFFRLACLCLTLSSNCCLLSNQQPHVLQKDINSFYSPAVWELHLYQKTNHNVLIIIPPIFTYLLWPLHGSTSVSVENQVVSHIVRLSHSELKNPESSTLPPPALPSVCETVPLSPSRVTQQVSHSSFNPSLSLLLLLFHTGTDTCFRPLLLLTPRS